MYNAHAKVAHQRPGKIASRGSAYLGWIGEMDRFRDHGGWSEYSDAGGLLSYGANQRATYFRLATYADRVWRSENPLISPLSSQPKFELVVNLKTAKALRIDVPTSILLRADKVIE